MDNAAYLLFFDNRGGGKYLILRDPEILELFTDFFSHLTDDLCCSREKSIEILEDILRESDHAREPAPQDTHV